MSANNVIWFNGYVSRKDREHLHGHQGLVVWFTGLSASGKSTIAHLVEKELYARGCSTYISAPYEPPENPEIVICSDRVSAVEASERVLAYIEDHIHIPHDREMYRVQGVC